MEKKVKHSTTKYSNTVNSVLEGYRSGITNTRTLSNKLDISHTYVRTILIHHGIITKTHSYTDADVRDRIRKLHEAGYKSKDIADETQVCQATVSALTSKINIPKNTIDKVVKLIKEGNAMKDIADATKVSINNVRKISIQFDVYPQRHKGGVVHKMLTELMKNPTLTIPELRVVTSNLHPAYKAEIYSANIDTEIRRIISLATVLARRMNKL